MQRYEKYKDSGVEWIGEIPDGWEVKKLKRLSTIKRGASPRPIADPKYFDNLGKWAWVRIADVSASERYLENTTQTLSELGASLSVKMLPNSFFLSIAGTVGKPIITNIQCCIHDGFVYFPSLNLNPEFLYYIFSTGQAYKGLGKLGTQLNLNTDTVGDITIPIPSADTITKIINYLDRKIAEIDQLIVQKKTLLCLYEEEKTAIINQAVTQGINPDVKLKDSGIDWLGETPEHWEVKKLKYVTSNLVSGPFGSSLKKEVYVNKGYKIYGQEQVIKNDMSYGNYYISEGKYNEMNRYKITKNDILISCVGTFGKILLVPEEFQKGIINPRLIKLSPIADLIEPIFLNILLKSPISFYQFNLLSRGGTMGVINLDLLKQLFFSIPPLSEQTAIVHHIETQTTRINAKIAKTKKIIALQKEYRTALISEVVTGKIKVTQEMARC